MDRKTAKKEIEKVVVHTGVGSKREEQGFEDNILPIIKEEITSITGQKPVEKTARQSISGFEVREGDVVSLMVTLRGDKMLDFLSKLVNVSLPRIKDFSGLSMDKVGDSGNLNIGIENRDVFPEVDPEEHEIDFGLQVTVVTKTDSRDKALEVYKKIYMPIEGVFEPESSESSD
ncbi:MAG: 50S ribosomal protein L5 [Candidatus Magasanikbacteria bacterium]